MSETAIETALFEIASSPSQVAAYKEDRSSFLSKFNLTEEERREILVMDVRKLLDRGCNPMLAMRTFNAIEGRDKLHEYLRRIRGTTNG